MYAVLCDHKQRAEDLSPSVTVLLPTPIPTLQSRSQHLSSLTPNLTLQARLKLVQREAEEALEMLRWSSAQLAETVAGSAHLVSCFLLQYI